MELFQSYSFIDNEYGENKIYYILKYPVKILLFLLVFFSYRFIEKNNTPFKTDILKYHHVDFQETELVPFNRYYLSNYFKTNDTDLDYYFNLTYLNFTHSHKFKMVIVEYNIGFYDMNGNIIRPSYAVSHNLHVNCHIEVRKTDTFIDSLANIIDDQYFKCTEIFNKDERIKFGIKIYKIKEDYDNPEEYNIEDFHNIYFFKEGDLKFSAFNYRDDDLFNPYVVNEAYISIARKMNDIKVNKTLKLYKSYIQFPYTTLKSQAVVHENKWFFRNIYNHYFCMCRGGACVNEKVNPNCKFLFYLHVIDKNRDVYPKTDYLFMDFIFKELSAVDTYPIFKEMLKQGLPVHYITEKENISLELNNSISIINANRDNATVNGDFLERYLSLFLRLKVIGTSRDGLYNNNLFYNIEYITYIFVGHGVCYFKYFLYGYYRYNLYKQFDKLLIPPSNQIISFAKKYGFNDEDIIQMNLPRWDKYNNITAEIEREAKPHNKTIFMMFSWRALQKDQNISDFYVDNITSIINNKQLNEELENNNINLIFGVHYTTKYMYRGVFKKALKKKKYMQYIEQDEISDTLSKANLLITDFASIIFDIIYREKPYVMFIPDAYDPKVPEIYTPDYNELLEYLKNDTITFENKFFNVEEALDKVFYYIKNNFKLDSKLKKFYKSFGFKKENSMNKFIDYLKDLK